MRTSVPHFFPLPDLPFFAVYDNDAMFRYAVPSTEMTTGKSTLIPLPVVVSLTKLIAAPAPMPTFPESSAFALAFAVLSTVAVAESFTSPLSVGGPRVWLSLISAVVMTSA